MLLGVFRFLSVLAFERVSADRRNYARDLISAAFCWETDTSFLTKCRWLCFLTRHWDEAWQGFRELLSFESPYVLLLYLAILGCLPNPKITTSVSFITSLGSHMIHYAHKCTLFALQKKNICFTSATPELYIYLKRLIPHKWI